MDLLTFIPLISVGVGCLMVCRRLLHYFQLESYQFAGFFRTLRRQFDQAAAPGLLLGFVSLMPLFLYSLPARRQPTLAAWILTLAAAAVIILCAIAIRRTVVLKGTEKKPFRVTARARRLMVCLTIVMTLVSFLFWLLIRGGNNRTDIVAASIVPLLLPLWVVLAALLAWPVERLIYELYFRDARRKLLADERLIRIGITGSYGKTSTKFILREMLSQKYNVLATPDSYNTPMGITTIIRSRLSPSHQVFIAEMGARHPQDIRELCRLVHPTIGVLTSVGPQHLDTFHTIDRIRETKYDLILSLPDDGLAVFSDDGAIVAELYERTGKQKLLANREGADAWASDITADSNGSSFMLHLLYREPFRCSTPLLGRHNIENIVLAATLADRLGVSPRQIQAAVAQLQPVDHRLKIVSNAHGVTVIDDAFNTNPVSSKAALDVLRSFPGRRIIVTPGMVELGADEPRYNREFGEYMAACADIVLLVGAKHTDPIRQGLLSKGFDETAVRTFGNLNDAVAHLNGITQPGDTVMYENDLPDSYAE